MPKQVWKFTLDVSNLKVQMPKGARLLCAHEQRSEICVWAEVDPSPDAPRETRTFEVYGTGHPMVDNPYRLYLGTAFLDGGALVFHVYEVRK